MPDGAHGVCENDGQRTASSARFCHAAPGAHLGQVEQLLGVLGGHDLRPSAQLSENIGERGPENPIGRSRPFDGAPGRFPYLAGEIDHPNAFHRLRLGPQRQEEGIPLPSAHENRLALDQDWLRAQSARSVRSPVVGSGHHRIRIEVRADSL